MMADTLGPVSALARWLARRAWWGMLFLMRRPWMRWAQERAVRTLPASARAGVRRSVADQNRFARKIGLPMLTVAFNLLLASMAITGIYYFLLYLAETGALRVPEKNGTGTAE